MMMRKGSVRYIKNSILAIHQEKSFQKALPVLDADFDNQQVLNTFYQPCMLSEHFGLAVYHFGVQYRLLLL